MEQYRQPEWNRLPPEVCRDDIVNVRPLGAQGGFSKLFMAYKTGLNVPVVVKRVKRELHGSLDEDAEARVMTALHHQYLPRIYDVRYGRDGYSYTVMEYIKGPTLREYVTARGNLDQKTAFRFMIQLCEAIKYMHEKNIIHSDLKPENVIITEDGHICVIDFNASLKATEGAKLEAIGVTPGYAAPEQYNVSLERFTPDHPLYQYAQAAQRMGNVTYRTDVYALGALGYYMVTGYDPNIWKDGVVPLDRFDIKLGDGFRAVIETAMAPKQEKRYANAEILGKELRRKVVEGDIEWKKWLRKRNAAIIIVVLMLSASITCLFTGWRMMQSEGDSSYMATIEQGRLLREEGQVDEAVETLLDAVSLDAERPEAYLELGALLYQIGDYRQAVDLLKDLEVRQSDAMDSEEFTRAQAQISYLLASCQYQLEQYSDALMNYQLATHFLPDQMEYQRDLAICYARSGRQQEAEETLVILRGMSCPEDSLALVEGEIDFAYGHYEDAVDQFRKAVNASGDSSVVTRAAMEGAESCRRLGTDWTQERISILQSAAAKLSAQDNSLLLQMQAEAYMDMAAETTDATTAASAYESALDLLDQVIRRGGRNLTLELDKAVVLQYLDRFDEAETMLTEMQTQYPYEYRVPMRLALLIADREGEKPTEQRNYAGLGEVYEEAERLYGTSGGTDGEMIRLQQLVQQLRDSGWTV